MRTGSHATHQRETQCEPRLGHRLAPLPPALLLGEAVADDCFHFLWKNWLYIFMTPLGKPWSIFMQPLKKEFLLLIARPLVLEDVLMHQELQGMPPPKMWFIFSMGLELKME